MNIAVKNTSTNHLLTRENTLIWAVICSALLHILIAVVIPNVKFNNVIKPDILEVALVKKPEPPREILPKPVAPQPKPNRPKIEHKSEPKTIVKSLPLKTQVKDDSVPVSALPPPTDVIAVASSPELPLPPLVVPEPAKIVAQVDTSAVRDSYGSSLWGAIEKHKQYPRVALMRGWQGEVVLELLVDGSGKLKSKKILKSSGYDILDKQALDMIEKAQPFPTPPDALRDSIFSIKVPIPFKLENQ